MTAFAPNTASNLRFDFNEAVAEARRDFPGQLKNVTFIDLDAPDAAEKMQAFYDSLSDKGRKEADEVRAGSPNFMTKDASPCVWKADGKGMLLAYGGGQAGQNPPAKTPYKDEAAVGLGT